MPARLLAILAAWCLVALGAPAADVAQVAAATARPNIIVFYIDDTSPHDGRLWGASDELGHDPTLTPSMYRHFIQNGVEFSNAIVENSLCCPARGNFLTGLHTHNNGVIDNDALLFDPSVHIGKAMQDAGYASMFIGKWMNRATRLSPEQWLDHQAGWTHHDVIYANNGLFNNYMLRTREGDLEYGAYHSTQMVADRTVMRINQTPAATPIFAVLSIYNLHAPNTVMPQFKGDSKCSAMQRWNPPNFNEADVSDKPAEIQALPLLTQTGGWPMVRYCEEMLGIDKAVGQVVAALDATGRLDNTVLVFTADNGIAWGAHRLGQQKIYPYTTPVPLYMSWPARWAAGKVTDPVTNIDLAPTFCDLAACTLNNYPAGQTAPDGVSLLPLLSGTAANLGREGLLEVSYLASRATWQAVRTTALYEGGLWHYVEYSTGERELYDVAADPYELENLAGIAGYEARIADLAALLDELRQEGVVVPHGTIRIRQQTVPADGTQYAFTSDLGDFVLSDPDPALDGEVTFRNVPVGSYTFRQSPGAGHPLANILCSSSASVDLANRSATIDLQPSTRATCTFVNAGLQPDAAIATSELGPFKADDFYSATVVDRQTVKRRDLKRGEVVDFLVRIQNDGGQTDTFTVRGVATGSRRMKVTYLDPADVTGAVSAGSYTIPDLAPGGIAEFIVRVTVGSRANVGATKTIDLTVTSTLDTQRVDVVRAIAKR